MSLTGNLEDLPLLDILQIVSFSKKTGYLTIRAEEGEGGIVFLDGLVVAAFTWDSLPVEPRVATLSEGARGKAIRSRIEIALEQLIRLREGQFNFSLTAGPPKVVGQREILSRDPRTTDQPPGAAARAGPRHGRGPADSTAAVEASFAQPEEVGVEALARHPEAKKIVAMHEAAASMPYPPDYEEGATIPIPAFRMPPPTPEEGGPVPEAAATPNRRKPPPRSADPARRRRGRRAEAPGRPFPCRRVRGGRSRRPEAAVKQGGRLGRENTPFLLVADLGMPTSGGTSFQGGFEVVKRLREDEPPPPGADDDGEPEARAPPAGPADGGLFVRLQARSREAEPQAVRSGHAGFRQEAPGRRASQDDAAGLAAPKKPTSEGAVPSPRGEASAEELAEQMSLLHRRLTELRGPGNANQIAMLVMKVAREFFERSILFLIKNGEARGLGGFGPAPRRPEPQPPGPRGRDLALRQLGLPRRRAKRPALRRILAQGKWTKHLLGKVGRFQSNTVALFPLVTHRESIAVLFGDNPDTGGDFRRLEALEMFIDQAGVALENAFLQRKIQALSERA